MTTAIRVDRRIVTTVLWKQVHFSGTVCMFGQAREVAECTVDVTAFIPLHL